MAQPVRLDHRAVVSVNGPDAETFLQGLLTQSVLNFRASEKRYAALLTPQGKVIADMLVERGADGFLIDCDRAAASALLKRLKMFRLRAAVTIEERADLSVSAFAGAPDPRSALAPARLIGPAGDAPADVSAYHAARIAAGLPEQGADFGAEDVFPADIDMDLVGGIDFRKGCFVGQEVVSRMKRRGIARRRTLKANLPGGAPATPAAVLAGDFEIGALTSAAGAIGLARIRIDRMAEAQAAGQTFTSGGKPVIFDAPDWLALELSALKDAR